MKIVFAKYSRIYPGALCGDTVFSSGRNWFEVELKQLKSGDMLIGVASPELNMADGGGHLDKRGALWSVWSGSSLGGGNHGQDLTTFHQKSRSGTRIGILVEFNEQRLATVSVYRNGWLVGILRRDLRAPLVPSCFLSETGDSVELILNSRIPPP
jgi:hypothetical protein